MDSLSITQIPAQAFITESGIAGTVLQYHLDHMSIQAPGELVEQRLWLCFQRAGQESGLRLEGDVKPADQHGVYIFQPCSALLYQDFLTRLRKDQHIEICQHQDVEATDRVTGFESYHFVPYALGQIAVKDIDICQSFLGHEFAAPLLITGMTGGVGRAREINERLAHGAVRFGIPMGVGSQRCALENPDLASLFTVKKQVPEVYLIGNLGCAQICQPDGVEQACRAIDMIEADALAIHLNVLQESFQLEGDSSFSKVLESIEQIVKRVQVPVVIKEVGAGLDRESAVQLRDIGVAAIDVGGRGGTSWAYIEGLRGQSEANLALARSFRDWGVPTAYALGAVYQECAGQVELVATGGIRDGLMVAKAVALGAQMVGVGLPFLRASLESQESLDNCIEGFIKGLKITMLATGCRRLNELEQRLSFGLPYEQEARSRAQGVGKK